MTTRMVTIEEALNKQLERMPLPVDISQSLELLPLPTLPPPVLA